MLRSPNSVAIDIMDGNAVWLQLPLEEFLYSHSESFVYSKYYYGDLMCSKHKDVRNMNAKGESTFENFRC